jgi:hypothetical protein
MQPLPMQPLQPMQPMQPMYYPAQQVQMQPLVQRRVVGQRLKAEGWCCVVVLGLVFWPVMCIPCCLPGCQEDIYEDVYIMPAGMVAPMPIVMPANNAGMGMPMRQM